LTSSKVIPLNRCSEELHLNESINSDEAEDIIEFDDENIEGSEDFHKKELAATSLESPRSKVITDSDDTETKNNRYV
jgi:hypothetical protein